MGLPWDVHMEAHLLDGVSDVGPREGKVLERACQAPVRCRVGDLGPVVLKELCLSVGRRGARFLQSDMLARSRMSRAYWH
jgi:hypothetical protein